jgi:hypothetical protein
MKKLINILLLTGLFAILPILNEQVEEAYWVGHVATKVEPAMIGTRNVGTTFQVEYNEVQVTLTNLHICRIPNMLRKIRRDDYNRDRIKDKLPPVSFPALQDSDLVDQYIRIGGHPRRIIAVDKFHDLCILEPNPNLKSLSLADSYRSGELVRVIGYPRGLSRTVRKGRIFDKQTTYFPWLQRTTAYVHISAIGYPGNSGSPVIDKYGRLIGVLFAGTSFHTESMIVPLEYVRNFLERELN